MPGSLKCCAVLCSQPVGLAVGSLCVGQFSQDQQWYRARVDAADSRDPVNPQYSVTFIDYGNKETLPASRVRAIEPQLAAVPPQASLCTLAFLKVRPQPRAPCVPAFASAAQRECPGCLPSILTWITAFALSELWCGLSWHAQHMGSFQPYDARQGRKPRAGFSSSIETLLNRGVSLEPGLEQLLSMCSRVNVAYLQTSAGPAQK